MKIKELQMDHNDNHLIPVRMASHNCWYGCREKETLLVGM